MARREQDETSGLVGIAVWCKHCKCPTIDTFKLNLHTVDTAEQEALRGKRSVVPVGESGEATVILLHIGSHTQKPMGKSSQVSLVAASVTLAILNLKSRERCLAILAPVHHRSRAVDQ